MRTSIKSTALRELTLTTQNMRLFSEVRQYERMLTIQVGDVDGLPICLKGEQVVELIRFLEAMTATQQVLQREVTES